MTKFEIYQVGKVPALTVIEAENFVLKTEEINRLVFYDENENYVAIFNFDNIAGFKEVNYDE